ncbi:DUF421 domain-containing protein [Bacillus cereus]|uniref:YetF C-terminal domain-containing protein n=3 Tax=Bacillus cereus group TaxID=86661 RepID=A0A9W5VEK4_BACCE|nr:MULTISPECIES: DUF421 domain-containing protein [Bacillus cereus group]AHZ54562.1 hypothetical protein YBT1520_30274 [Bacillus thuringiensis serovar kurstaki str. YBT-1520]AIE37199.1 hypothetical protein BTK_33386 [Bacillus thuringiensis serovar kurstaki str. HD-1]AIE37615.1 hypothetical protein BTK_30079 [Bacillus thuringiensis serovar kurstaki str. HD-1]AIM35031.1 hypothetical protein DF16_pBMB400orf00196 [Bacillus thuringiensis serovar kurstaki str. YBT-1520]AJK38135.1 hypothetical protei
MNFIWQSLILILAGILLLRIAGRKSISQMTLAQTVVMISIGTIIVQPIVEKSTIKAVTSAFIFVVTVILLEYFQLKSNTFEKFITGKSKVVIEDGRLNIENLTKLRLTVDQLEMRLRNQGISKIADVKTATLEPNGQLGYELKDEAKPLTVRDFHKIMQSYNQSLDDVHNEQRESNNIFQEVKNTSKNKNNHSHKELK